MAVQTLVVKVGSDISQALSGLNRLSTKTIQLGRNMKRTGGMLSRNLTAPLVGAGAAAVGAAVRAGNMADALLDLEQQTGLSTTTLQEFRRVTSIAGIDTDALAIAAQKLNTRIKATGDESLETKNAFALLGVNTRDAQGNLRDMDQLMPEIIGKLGTMANETERNSLATQIFGRGATEMLPVLGLTADEFGRAREEAHEMGLVLSRDTLNSANEFRKVWDTLKQSLGAVATEIGVAVIPHVEGMVATFQSKVLPVGRKVVEWIGNLNPTLVQASAAFAGVTAMIGPVALAAGGLVTIFGSMLAPAAAVAAGLGTLAFVATVVVKNWDVMKIRMTLVWAAIKDAVFTAVDGILGGLEKLTGFVPVLGDKVRELRSNFNRFADESMAKSGRKLIELERQLVAGSNATAGMTTSLEGLDVNMQNVAASTGTAAAAQERLNAALTQRPETLDVSSRREDESMLPGFENMPARLETIEQGLGGVQETGMQAMGNLRNAAQNAISGGLDAIISSVSDAGKSFTDFIKTTTIQLGKLVAKLVLVKALSAAIPGIGGFLGGGGGGLFGLANGGFAPVNRPRLIGERGPELFIPSSSGRVMNNRETMALAGGGSMDRVAAALRSMPSPSTPEAISRDAIWRQAVGYLIEDYERRRG